MISGITLKTMQTLCAKLYQGQEMSIKEIAEEVGLSPSSVRRLLLEEGVELRTRGTSRFNARKSPLHNVKVEDWARGVPHVAALMKLPYARVYNFYVRYRGVLDEAVQEHRSGKGDRKTVVGDVPRRDAAAQVKVPGKDPGKV